MTIKFKKASQKELAGMNIDAMDFGGYLFDIAECDGFNCIDTLAAAYDAAAGVTLIALVGKAEF